MASPTATCIGNDDRYAEVFLKGRTVTSTLGLCKPPRFKTWKSPQPDRCYDKVKEYVGYTDSQKDQSAAAFILPSPLPFEFLFVPKDPSAKPDQCIVEVKDDLGYADAQKDQSAADIFLPGVLPLETYFVPEEPSAAFDRHFLQSLDVEVKNGVGYTDAQKNQSAVDIFLPIEMALSPVPFKACLDPEESDAYAGEDVKSDPVFSDIEAFEETGRKNGTNIMRNSLQYSSPGDFETLMSSTDLTTYFSQTREGLVKSVKEGGSWSTVIMNASPELHALGKELSLDLSSCSSHLKTSIKRPRVLEVEERETRNRKKVRLNILSSFFFDFTRSTKGNPHKIKQSRKRSRSTMIPSESYIPLNE